MYSQKILHLHIFHDGLRMGSGPSEGLKIGNETLGIDGKKIQAYAKKVLDILDKNPEVRNAITETFSRMSEDVLKNPENIQKIFEKIEESGVIDSLKKTEFMLALMEKHAVLAGNSSLKDTVNSLARQFASDEIGIRANTSTKVHELSKSISQKGGISIPK